MRKIIIALGLCALFATGCGPKQAQSVDQQPHTPMAPMPGTKNMPGMNEPAPAKPGTTPTAEKKGAPPAAPAPAGAPTPPGNPK